MIETRKHYYRFKIPSQAEDDNVLNRTKWVLHFAILSLSGERCRQADRGLLNTLHSAHQYALTGKKAAWQKQHKPQTQKSPVVMPNYFR